jgi:hypothetical protein
MFTTLRHASLLAATAVAILVSAGAVFGPSASPASAYRQLGSLEGTWSRTTAKGTVVELTYEPISSGSALLEHFSTSTGRKTLTVYHMDDADLLLTHYCAQGNQPRLRYVPGEDSTSLRFTFLDATNLPNDSASHMVRLELHLADSTHLRVIEVYRTALVDEADTLYYLRKP